MDLFETTIIVSQIPKSERCRFRGYLGGYMGNPDGPSQYLNDLFQEKRSEKLASSIYRLKAPEPLDEITTSFNDNGFNMKDNSTGVVMSITYDDISQFVETETLYTIITARHRLLSLVGRWIPLFGLVGLIFLLASPYYKTLRFGIINKKEIDKLGKRDELIDFLGQNCKNIKWDVV